MTAVYRPVQFSMKNANDWKPSKYVLIKGGLRASNDPTHVGIGSRLAANISADIYWQYLRGHCAGRLLDLGCGNVPLFEAYRDLVEEIVCVDWPNTLHRNEHIDQDCDLSKPLPLSSGSFDTIILSSVLEHISEPACLWREMARVLRPGGRILMNVPFLYGLHETPHDYYRYTEYALRRFAELEGLQVLHLDATGGAPEVLVDIIAKNLVAFGWGGRNFANVIQRVAWWLIRTKWGRRVSQRTAILFPFGYFMIVEKPENSRC